MLRERKIYHPFNHAFEIMYDAYPKELHENLKVPGIFVRKSEVKIRLYDGRVIEMDASYIIDPDYEEIFERMVANLEHQSTPVDDEKIDIISRYGIGEIQMEGLPHLSVVASHLPKEVSKKSHRISPSDILEPYYLDLGSEDNKQRLINARRKINNNEELTSNDELQLGVIVLFAPRDRAREITEEVVGLYLRIIEKLSLNMEYVLYSVLYSMIDAYFDDEDDF